MKKRKKPIFLVAVLILVGGVAFGLNSVLMSTPKTAEDFARQAAEAQAAQNPPSAPAEQTPAAPPSDPGPMVSPKDENMADANNIKPIPAVPENAPKISAPLNMRGKDKTPDRANPSANGQWWEKGSYAGSH